VHTYSLVHDDLPAMDDDDLRRGRPTCHKAFGEATAILTGDALLTMAFEILAREIPDPGMAVRLIRTLAEVAGASGMIAGQMDDMQSQNAPGTVAMLQNIHLNKTAKMFAGSAAMGAIVGSATDEQIDCLVRYGLQVGLGFQIADDILDVSGTTEELGKTPGKDHKQGKVTYPAVVGMDESRRIAGQMTQEALDALRFFDGRADRLRELAEAMLTRTR
jgi:geranylgeranyl diphosphate synthase type II